MVASIKTPVNQSRKCTGHFSNLNLYLSKYTYTKIHDTLLKFMNLTVCMYIYININTCVHVHTHTDMYSINSFRQSNMACWKMFHVSMIFPAGNLHLVCDIPSEPRLITKETINSCRLSITYPLDFINNPLIVHLLKTLYIYKYILS